MLTAFRFSSRLDLLDVTLLDSLLIEVFNELLPFHPVDERADFATVAKEGSARQVEGTSCTGKDRETTKIEKNQKEISSQNLPAGHTRRGKPLTERVPFFSFGQFYQTQLPFCTIQTLHHVQTKQLQLWYSWTDCQKQNLKHPKPPTGVTS